MCEFTSFAVQEGELRKREIFIKERFSFQCEVPAVIDGCMRRSC